MVSIDGMDMLCPPEPDAEKLIAKLPAVADYLSKEQPEMAGNVLRAAQVISQHLHKIELLRQALAQRSDDGEEWD